MNNADTPIDSMQHQDIDANSEFFKPGWKGLTKREHFAAMAMQGLLSNVNEMKQLSDACSDPFGQAKFLGISARIISEAVLAELDNPTNNPIGE